MTTYNTGNPVGSVDVRDLYDNAENLDNFSNGPLDAYPDRFGVSRQSWAGMEAEFDADQVDRAAQWDAFLLASGYQVLGPYGAGLVFTAPNQLFSYLGEFYAPGPAITLPYTTTGAGAGEIANFRSVGDAVLRDDLSNDTDPAKGAACIGRNAQVVDSIAELRSLIKTSASQEAIVTGYYSQGDGGGGVYYLDAADVTSSDDGGTVIIANDGGRWKLEPSDFLNVKQFGARGDSITDDTGCIQAAFDAVHTTSTGMWRKILFPLGGYFVSQTLVAKPNTHISGVGSRIGCAIIRQGNYGHTITCGNDSTGAQGFQCEDLEFIHGDPFSGTEPTMSEISWYSHLFLRGSNTASVRRCYFSRMRHGIYVSGGYWVHITDCLFYGVYDPAVPAFQEGFSNIIFDYDELYGYPIECWVKDNNLAGAKKLNVVGFQIPTADGTYLTQAGDFFEYGMASNHGIDVRAVESLYILGNYFGERAGAGVNLSGRAIGPNPFNLLNVRISDCMFDPCRGGQVTFAPVLNDCFALNTIISNNTFIGRHSGFSAIISANNPNNTPTAISLTISGNLITGHYGSGIILDGAKGFVVTGNVITDYNSLGAATADVAFVAAVAVRGSSSKGLISSNTIGGGNLFSDAHHCIQGIVTQGGVTGIVQSGNHRVGTVNWVAQTYPV